MRPLVFTLMLVCPLAAGCDTAGSTPLTDLADGPILIPQAEDWTSHGPVISPGPAGHWDMRLYGMMNPGAVIRKDGRYLLYYLGADGNRYDDGPANRALGVAISSDGITFEKHPGNPVLRHQPDGGHGNRVEEGIFSAAAALDEDGSVLLYFGGMESVGAQVVDGDAVLAQSRDGLDFHVVGDVISHADPEVYNHGDEIFPAAAWVAPDGRHHVYYVAKGHVAMWTLGIASGASPDALANTRKALDLELPIHGAGVPVLLPGEGLILPVHVAADGPDRIDILLIDPGTPHDLSRRLGSIELAELGAGPDVDFGTATLFLDLENQRWLLYHVDAGTGDIRLRSASVRYPPPS